MTFEEIISTLTVISTLSVKLIGFPSQIRKIHKAGNLKGVSVIYFILVFITYGLWTIHGIVKHDNTIIIGQGIGVIASGLLLIILLLTARKAKKNNIGLQDE
jgi:uncharacterized protein with PQ loop repeat